jgi:hypothetical protein
MTEGEFGVEIHRLRLIAELRNAPLYRFSAPAFQRQIEAENTERATKHAEWMRLAKSSAAHEFLPFSIDTSDVAPSVLPRTGSIFVIRG